MGDSWLQQLVVRGPAAEVTAFRRAVASPEKPVYWTVDPACRTQLLSFARMSAFLPRPQARRFEAEIEEPWDLVVDPARHFKDGSREVTYKFQLSRFEPEDLIVAVSRLYPRLWFVVGCVAPFVDQQSSLLVHKGRSWRWRLPATRQDAIRKELVPEDTEDDSDEVVWREAEADWRMLDEVVAHWQPKMGTLMARVLKKNPGAQTRRRRSAPRRRKER